MIAYSVLQQVTAILRTLTILLDGTSFTFKRNPINKRFENIVGYFYTDKYQFEEYSCKF